VKNFILMFIAALVSLSFMAVTVTAKDKSAKGKKAKVVKECKKDGTKCTADELKDKKLKKMCKNPCPCEDKAPGAPPADPGSNPPPAPPAGQ
jgi:hypothetical protein